MDLDKLLYLQGVGNGFVDCNGVYHDTPTPDREFLLKTMCFEQVAELQPNEFAAWVDARIDELDVKPWTKLLRPLQWTHAHEPCLSFHVPADFSGDLLLDITLEPQSSASPSTADIELSTPQQTLSLFFNVADTQITGDYLTRGRRYLSRQIALTALLQAAGQTSLPLGYHQITLAYASAPTEREAGILLVTPAQVFGADLASIAPQKRPWGSSLQVFSLWHGLDDDNTKPTAFGDFAALAETIELLAAKGADFLLLNPLHALPLHQPEAASPYSPYDRRRLNPLYIAPNLSAEGNAADWSSYLPKRMPKVANGTDWIDYTAAANVKAAELKAMFKVFSGYDSQHPRRLAYSQFLEDEGESLQFYAEHQAAHAKSPWLKNSEFYCYLQFVAEEQLAGCQALAKQQGMAIGLVRDLAVGAVGEGVEVAQAPEQFCTRASIGAPPDPFAPQGQNWGLTPLDPIGLKQHNFKHFIQLLRTNMRHCGALRIDHFMGLFRLWWWPIAQNLDAAEQPGGAYIYYPFELMMAIMRYESHRAGCMVIGEDLGIVPPEIKAPMTDAGIYSNELFYFCSDHYRYPQYAGFKAPQDYKFHALMMLANHDVPTMAAWWQGLDLLKRAELNLLTDDELLHEQQLRQQQRIGVLHWLADIGGLALDDLSQNTPFDELLPTWARAVAGGNSQLYSLSLADLLAETDAINIPGTSVEYPNWRRRYSASVQQLNHVPLLNDVLIAVNSARNAQN